MLMLCLQSIFGMNKTQFFSKVPACDIVKNPFLTNSEKQRVI